jgi:hypothetical protein
VKYVRDLEKDKSPKIGSFGPLDGSSLTTKTLTASFIYAVESLIKMFPLNRV